MEEYEFLEARVETGVLWVILNRPKANAFNQVMIEELQGVLKLAGREKAVRVVLLSGGGRFFSAGQDISLPERGEADFSFRDHLQGGYNRIVLQMRRLEKPILAAINGPAAGAGLGIALAADLRVMAEGASLVFGFTGIGLTADSGTSLTLPSLVGLTRAAEVAYLNQPVGAKQALDFGLVNEVVEAEGMMSRAEELARKLAEGPTAALGLTKRAFNRSMYPNLERVLDYEAHLQEIAGRTEDHREGVAAFAEKRPPEFKGL